MQGYTQFLNHYVCVPLRTAVNIVFIRMLGAMYFTSHARTSHFEIFPRTHFARTCAFCLILVRTRTRTSKVHIYHFLPFLPQMFFFFYISTRYLLLMCECGCGVKSGKTHMCVRSACGEISQSAKCVRASQNTSHLTLWL